MVCFIVLDSGFVLFHFFTLQKYIKFCYQPRIFVIIFKKNYSVNLHFIPKCHKWFICVSIWCYKLAKIDEKMWRFDISYAFFVFFVSIPYFVNLLTR